MIRRVSLSRLKSLPSAFDFSPRFGDAAERLRPAARTELRPFSARAGDGTNPFHPSWRECILSRARDSERASKRTTTMAHRGSTCALALTAALMGALGAAWSAEAPKYPDWQGQWERFV